ncbi:unnamed protein product [Linum tenue]|uniref:Disease resistance protein RGA3 n=1 Tax=Linum tenue TaxID=586396 RepID=A0AAV0PR13_9ROSI|nr:unnamed protein product [Linum tenue]
MAAALAELVLHKLSSLAADQASLLWGLRSEIPKLASTVSSIQAVLLDADNQAGKSHQVQLWLQGLEEVLYDAEDLLDDFSTEVLRRKQQMDINGVVNEARPVDPVAANKDWRQTHSSVPDVVIGREGDKQMIIDMLLLSGNKEKVVVVPIVGIGGLGKTTVAQLIYNDNKIQSHFDCTHWVCVSETFDPKVMVKNVLESITQQKVEDLALNTLKDLLHKHIKNKRLLLVLDDVWNEDTEKWVRFINIFSSGAAEGSRIVVTTRLRIVAKMTATEMIVPHELQGLSELESWSLFEKMAFKGGVAPGPRYIEIGKEVTRKCCGVPLAIRTMGGLLSFKDTESEWEAIREKQLLSLYFSGQDSEILAATLRLSYDNLPSQLKRCFAYCSLFPKDHRIDVKMLVQVWMAQGYIIKSGQFLLLEDVGVEHFKNLLWRSFFQEVTKDRYGNMKYCKMHDLMHDLAVTVAGMDTICLNAINLTDSLLSSGVVNLERIRHLSIDFENKWETRVWKIPTLLAKATRLRTFMIINVAVGGVKLEGRCEIFLNMTRLRVFGLGDAKMEVFSITFNKLKHLRYLDLSKNGVEILPNEITRMVNLQTLNLCLCEHLRLLPADLGKLYNLVFFYLDDCSSLTYLPAGICNLSFLRELSLFILTEAAAKNSRLAGLGELKSLNNLSGKLTIKGLELVKDKSEAAAANLKEKSQLQHLELWWSDDSNNMVARRCDHERSVLEALQPHPNLKELQLCYYGGTSVPTASCWFSSLMNLVRIELYCCGKLQSLPSLDPFVSLEELVLYNLESLAYVQGETVSSLPFSSLSSSNKDLQFLPSLKSLKITDCPNLIGWSLANMEESPLLPWVSTLEIESCPKMVTIPHFLINFKKVELMDVSSELLSVFGASLISPSLPPAHPRFHELCLQYVNDLPQGLMPQLTSLERLNIWFCSNLTTLSPSILRHLPSLKELHILSCEVLELEDYDYGDGNKGNDENDSVPPRFLPSLRCLVVQSVPKLVTLPNWLQFSSNLQQLDIDWCDNLKCLPSWLKKLTALESLGVFRCDILSRRCTSNTAEDWPIISHIPNIQVDSRHVQKEGCYLEMEEEEEEAEQEQEHEEEASSHTHISSLNLQAI